MQQIGHFMSLYLIYFLTLFYYAYIDTTHIH